MRSPSMHESRGSYLFRAVSSTTPMLRRLREERRLALNCARSRSLVLTFDDGPTLPATERVLDLLATEDTLATFFLLGARAEQNPLIVDEMAGYGHEIGCHSYAHRNAWRTPPAEAITDIEDGYTALSRWIAPNGIFRPPYGKITVATSQVVRRKEAPLGWWTIVSGDTENVLPNPHLVVNRVIGRGGGVVLLHDGHPVHPFGDRRIEYLLETTQLLIRAAKRHGLHLKRLSDVT